MKTKIQNNKNIRDQDVGNPPKDSLLPSLALEGRRGTWTSWDPLWSYFVPHSASCILQVCAGRSYSHEASELSGFSATNGASWDLQSCQAACPWAPGVPTRVQLIQYNFKYSFSLLPPTSLVEELLEV